MVSIYLCSLPVSLFITSDLQLMDILSDPNNEECISWLPHGCSFRIHNRTKFLDEILPQFYNNKKKIKYTSFTRKLSRWDFVRLSSGPDTGAFYHKMFQRDNPKLARKMFCKGERPQFVRTLGSIGGAPLLPGTFGGIGWNTALGLAGLPQQQVQGGDGQQQQLQGTPTAGAPGAPDMNAFMANMNNPNFKANILAQQQLLQQQQQILQQQLAASGAAPMPGMNGMQLPQQQQQQPKSQENQQEQPQEQQPPQLQEQQPQDNQDQLRQFQQQLSAQQMAMMSPQAYLAPQKLEDTSEQSASVQQQFMSAGSQEESGLSAGGDDTAPNGAKRAWAA